MAESQVPKLDLMPLVQLAEYNILAGCSPKCAGLKALNSTSVQSHPNKSATRAARKNTSEAHKESWVCSLTNEWRKSKLSSRRSFHYKMGKGDVKKFN